MKTILAILLAISSASAVASSERDGFLYELSSVNIEELSFTNAQLSVVVDSIEAKYKKVTGKNLSITVVHHSLASKNMGENTIFAKDLPLLEMLTYVCEMSGASLKVINEQLLIEQITLSGRCSDCRGGRLEMFDWNEKFTSTLGLSLDAKESDIHKFLSESGIRMDYIKITLQPDYRKLFIAGTSADLSDIRHLIRLREKGFEIKKFTTSGLSLP